MFDSLAKAKAKDAKILDDRQYDLSLRISAFIYIIVIIF